jgi:hypothetical protein
VTLADLFRPNTSLVDTLIILARLRNTVHSEMIRATMRQSVRSRDAVIRLPKGDEQSILEAMEALGGREAWGVRTNADGSEVVDPGLFVELLFPKVLTLLNAVMERTPSAVGAGPRSQDKVLTGTTNGTAGAFDGSWGSNEAGNDAVGPPSGQSPTYAVSP